MWIMTPNHSGRIQLQAEKTPMHQKQRRKRSIDGDTESNTEKQYSNCFVKFITF